MNEEQEFRRELEDPLQTFDIHTQANIGAGLMSSAHYHNYVEILYALSGSFEAQFGGVKHTFGRGEMVLIPSQEVHRIFSAGDETNLYAVIKFRPSHLLSAEQSAAELKYLLDFSMRGSDECKFSAEDLASENMHSLVQLLLDEIGNKNYGYELAVRAGLNSILVLILRIFHQRRQDDRHHLSLDDLHKLQAVFDFVEENYASNISMEEVAASLDMSYSTFSRFFNKHIQKSFSAYVCDVRISKAKILLLTTKRSITDIAMETGFSTSSYFIQRFKEHSGTVPKQFRKQFNTKPV